MRPCRYHMRITSRDPDRHSAQHLLESRGTGMADDLKQSRKNADAAKLGHKGRSPTARKLGSKHHRQMAAARQTRGGGRPRKQQ